MHDQEDRLSSSQESLLTRADLLRLGAGVGAGLVAAPLFGAYARGASAATDLIEASGGTINFYSWQTYDLPYPAMKKWLKQHHITLHARYVSNGDDITAKFTTGGGKGVYNLSTYGAPYGPLFKRLNIVEPLDLSRIPNYNHNFFPFFRSGPTWKKYWNMGGKQYGIPFAWGYSATNYDSSKVHAPRKASDLLKPPFLGKFAMTDDSQGLIVQGALIAGVANPNCHFTRDDLNKIFDVLKTFKKAAKRVGVSFGDLANMYQNGEVVASLTTWQGFNTLVPGMENKIKSTLLAEGALGWCDSYFIPQGSKDTDAVYAWLNEISTPQMQVTIAEKAVVGITNAKTVPKLNSKFRNMLPYNKLSSFFAKAPLFGLPVDVPQGGKIMTLSDWTQVWEAFKNA
jgi:spermidine/putrescine-binding protein